RLTAMVSQDEVRAAALPYSEEVRNKLQASGGWLLVPLPEDRPAVLHVQSPNLQERAPNPFDTNWNAHLWYFPTSLSLTNLTLAATRVVGGAAVQGTVTLSGQAPAGGAT